jgi:hypothetical protein
MKRNLFTGFWRFNGIALLNLLLLFCLSCQKEESQANLSSVTDDNITFRDGRLIFKDYASFTDYQEWLSENQSNTQLIVEKNKSLGLKSMTEYYLEGMKLEEDDPKFSEYVSKYPRVFYKEIFDNSTLYVLPHSIILCYVANEDGIFQIGDQIYRIVQNYIYQTADESKIEMLFLPQDQILIKDIKITPSQPRHEAKSDLGQKTVYFNNNSKYRIVSSIMEYTNGVSYWYDIRTNPQKKTLVWLGAQLNTKAAHGDGYWTFGSGSPLVQIYSNYDEDTGDSQRNIVFCGGSLIDLNASYSPAYSRGRLIDGVTEYIYINWADALSDSPTYTVTHTSILNDPF